MRPAATGVCGLKLLVHECSLDALIHRGLFYELSRRNVSTADEMYCRAQEIDGKRAKDKYDQVNPKFRLVSSSIEV